MTFLGAAWCGTGIYTVLMTGQPRWLFDPFLSGCVRMQEPFTGLRLRWDSVEGSLGQGRFHFTGFKAIWMGGGLFGFGNGRKFDCDVSVKEVVVELGRDTARLLLRDGKKLSANMDSLDDSVAVSVPKLHLSGLSGNWIMRVRNPLTPLPNVRVEDLKLESVSNLTVVDTWNRAAPLAFPVVDVEMLQVAPYVVRKPAHSLLLHADGTGRVGGKPFRVEQKKTLQAALPFEWITRLTRPPLSYVKSGAAKIVVSLKPQRGSPNKWDASLELAITGEKRVQRSDTGTDLPTQAVLSYLDHNIVSLKVRSAEIRSDIEDEDRFLQDIGLALGIQLVAEAATSSAAKAVSSWWNGIDEEDDSKKKKTK